MKLFSQRKAGPTDPYSYAILENARSRILHTFQQHRDGWGTGGRYDFPSLLQQVSQQLLSRKGSIRSHGHAAARMSDHPVINHFLICSDEEVLDFIELCFQTDTMGGDNEGSRQLVGAVNRIFEEEGIGYELTPPLTIDTGKKAYLFGSPTGGNHLRTEFPKIIRKDECAVHDKNVKPALEVLRDPRLATANSELLTAFEKARTGDYADAITSCGAAFESVLKTICNIKCWSYDPDRDTCARLVGICKGNGLFFPFYSSIFEGIGTVRNKLGDAHGKGPKAEHVAQRAHAEHMIAITCAHIHFLFRQAVM